MSHFQRDLGDETGDPGLAARMLLLTDISIDEALDIAFPPSRSLILKVRCFNCGAYVDVSSLGIRGHGHTETNHLIIELNRLWARNRQFLDEWGHF